jgi:(2Fe-2S) ferredoxin
MESWEGDASRIIDLRSRVYLVPMMERSKPRMESYSRHILVCTGSFCSPDARGRELYSLLAQLLQREDLLFGPDRVKRGETPCLGVCSNGPIVVVYPDGIWYSSVTPELLERIVVEHLKGGRPVAEAIFHTL